MFGGKGSTSEGHPVTRQVELPVLTDFLEVVDETNYAPLPDDWVVGVCDVVESTKAIAEGRYRAVNLAGAGSISAVANALGGGLELFVFGGDGASFAIPADRADSAADALARAAMWVQRDLELELRVGMTRVADIRDAGFDLRGAFWQASGDVCYAMFAGGGMDWAEAQLKRGAIGLAAARASEEPDLTGLSCRWGPITPLHGKVLSLIVKPAPRASADRFARVTRRVVAVLERAGSLNPVPPEGPKAGWPSVEVIRQQTRIASGGRSRLARRINAYVFTLLAWAVFGLGLRIGGFDPGRYRRELAANTDFRKFNDGLMMTVDCTPRAAAHVQRILDAAARRGVVRYGLHLQDQALITCIVPSALKAEHMHFLDGAGGGYASAAKALQRNPRPTIAGDGGRAGKRAA